MTGEIVLTIVGNLTADPEVRTVGQSNVANFTVASTARTFDRQANEWKDAETVFMRCQAWRDLADNIARSAGKGTRVIVTGLMKSRSYTTQPSQNGPGGETRTVTELEVQEIGLSLRYAAGHLTQANPGRGQQQGGYQQQGQQQQQQQYQPQGAYGAPPGSYQPQTPPGPGQQWPQQGQQPQQWPAQQPQQQGGGQWGPNEPPF